MARRFRGLRLSLLSVGLIAGATLMDGQITSGIQAQVDHKFYIGNTQFPPGKYMFRMMQGSDLSSMTATNQDNDTSTEFLVRQSQDAHRPTHSELAFRKYGSEEFLSHIYQDGVRSGVAVIEPSREEQRLKKQGQKPIEHTEEQK